MSDQFGQLDPTSQYGQPGDAQEIERPGVTAETESQPDHGERSYRRTDRLWVKRAIITGGDSGIGRAVAIAFAREGADVVLSYLESKEEDAQETKRWIENAGRKAITAPGDIREQAQCERLVQLAVNELGGLDVRVNNAAYQMSQEGGLADISEVLAVTGGSQIT
jgi:hypothetical protein